MNDQHEAFQSIYSRCFWKSLFSVCLHLQPCCDVPRLVNADCWRPGTWCKHNVVVVGLRLFTIYYLLFTVTVLCLKKMENTPMKMSFVNGSRIITVHTSEDCSETSKITSQLTKKSPCSPTPIPFLPKHHSHSSFKDWSRKGVKIIFCLASLSKFQTFSMC